MADWVHCNLCFRQPGDGREYLLTNCGHIYCNECVAKGTQDKCKMCSSRCSTIALSSKMKPEVEMFFTDPAQYIKQQQKQLMQLLSFQRNHRQRLTAHMRERVARVAQAQRLIDICKEQERELMVLRDENAYLKKLIKNLQDSPGSNMRAQSGDTLRRAGGQTPSPTAVFRAASTSASLPRKSPNSVNQHPQQNDLRSSQGPARLLVRTPPSNGKIGRITPPSRGQESETDFYGSRRRVSPMQCSPNSYKGRSKSPMFGTPSTFLSNNQTSPNTGPGMTQRLSSVTSVPKKQIQLSYEPGIYK